MASSHTTSWTTPEPFFKESNNLTAKNMLIIRVPHFKNPLESETCLFDRLQPDPTCPNEFYTQLLHILLRIVAPKVRYRIRFLEATSWDDPTDNTSCINILASGQADMTTTGFTMSFERLKRHGSVGITYSADYAMFYRRYQQQQRSLSATELIFKPRGVWAALLICFIVKFLVKNSYFGLLVIKNDGEEKQQEHLFGSYPITNELPIRSGRDLMTGLLRGDYLAVVPSGASRDLLFHPGIYRFERIMERNPPVIESNVQDVVKAFRSETADSRPKLVYISLVDRETDIIKQETCELVQVESEDLPKGKRTMLFDRKFKPLARTLSTIPLSQLLVFQAERQRLRIGLFHETEHICSIDPTGSKGDKFRLHMKDILGLLEIFLGLIASSTLLFLIEMSNSGMQNIVKRFNFT